MFLMNKAIFFASIFAILIIPTERLYAEVLAKVLPAMPLSLAEAIEQSLENNVDIHIERENIRRQGFALFLEKAKFDATLSLDARSNRSVRSSTSGIETGPSGTSRIIRENQQINAGLNQRFPWGGDYDLTLGQFRSKASFQTVNPTLSSNLIFSFTQPLLQGYGKEINETPLRIAQTSERISQAAFQSQLMAIILEVGVAYWDLVFQLNNLEVAQQTGQSAAQVLDAIREKVKIGLLAPIEILVAESALAAREEAIVIAKKDVQDTEDKLRLLMNLPEQSLLKPPALHPSDQATTSREAIDEEALLRWAISQRPELKEKQLLLDNLSLSVKLAEDRLAPSLDLVGNVGLNGLGSNFPNQTEQLSSGSFYQWEAGLVLSLPIGNREARARLQIEKVALKQEILERKKQVQTILKETKEGLRRVSTDFRRIASTGRAQRLAEEKLKSGNERFDLGLLSSHDLLEFQDDLAGAKGKALKALTDYNKSLINLEKVSGRLLSRYGIKTVSPEALLH